MNTHPKSNARRVAVVHDWLPLYGGAERVLEQILAVYPEADLFSLIDGLDESNRAFLKGRPVRTSFVQRMPGGKRHYRHYFPLMPLAMEQMEVSGYDLVISSSYAFAKGVITGPSQLHVCYCHSPIRYGWDLQHQYLRESKLERGLLSWVTRMMLHYVRLWDMRTAAGVDVFLANSSFVARRIEKVYRREAEVVHPPVDLQRFTPRQEKEDFYLAASRLVPYKRMDLVVRAFAGMPDKRLVVIGDGPELARLRRIAAPNVEFLGWQSNESMVSHMERAKAFVFAGEEDFGIILLEAQAAGTPVVAFGRGGALETVRDGETGLLFDEQTPESLQTAVREAERRIWSAAACRAQAERFSIDTFRSSLNQQVEAAWERFGAARPMPTRLGEKYVLRPSLTLLEA